MHGLFWESCWIHNFALQLPEASIVSFLNSRIHWNFQLSSRIFDGFFIFSIFRINETNASQSSSIIDFWLLDWLSSLLSGFSNFGPHFRPHILRSSSCLNFCQSPPNHQYPFGGFSFNNVNFVNPVQESDKLPFASTPPVQYSSLLF